MAELLSTATRSNIPDTNDKESTRFLAERMGDENQPAIGRDVQVRTQTKRPRLEISDDFLQGLN